MLIVWSVVDLGDADRGSCLLWIKNSAPGGGTCDNFDRDASVIFLGLKFTKMSFFWVSLSWRHFFGD